LQNGHEITDSVTAHRGDTLNPVPKQELIEKFKFLANDALGEEGAGRVVDLVDRLESLADIKELTANL